MGVKTNVVARLVTAEDIESAVITTLDNPNGVDFRGMARDQTAEVETDSNGRLLWGLSLDTQFAFGSWKLMLTKKGDTEGAPVAFGISDSEGVATAGGIKNF